MERSKGSADEASISEGLNAVASPVKFNRKLDVDLFSTKKTAAEGLLDLALLIANASQLKQLLTSSRKHKYFIVVVIALSLSIVLQIAVAIALLISARIRVTRQMSSEAMVVEDEKMKQQVRQLSRINIFVNVAIVLLIVLNIVALAFGISGQAAAVAVVTS